jgi:uncharacterized protein with HEPN domain
MRDDDALLLDMLIAARKIQRFVAGMTFEEFEANEMAQSAVLREFQVIGEAARLVTDATRTACVGIEWQLIVGMRNRLVHEYFEIRLDVVWETVRSDIPILITQLGQYIAPNSPNVGA